MMLFSRKIFLLSVLVLSFVLHAPHDLLAVDEEQPIIARVYNDIYTVSPSDGEARLIFSRDPEKNKFMSGNFGGSPITLYSISPDNTKFVFTNTLHEILDPEFEEQQRDIAFLFPNDITIVDIATGTLMPITNQGPNLAALIESDTISSFDHLTWSVDEQRLYFMTSVKSLRNRVTQLMVEYYDLQTGERHVFVKLSPQSNTSLYAISQGLLLVDGSAYTDEDYKYTLYDLDGNLVNSLTMPMEGTMQCSNPSTKNPVFMQDDYYFGYYTRDLGPAALLDVASGDSIPLEGELVPALISHTHRDTSLRVVGANLCSNGGDNAWIVSDAEGLSVSSMGLSYIEADDSLEFALSPDGQSIAYLKHETASPLSVMPIMVATAEGTRELDFEATHIFWGATDAIFAPDFESPA